MAITCESTDLTSVEAEDLQRNRGVPTPWFVGAMQGAGAMLVDMFWDLSNIEISLRAMGQGEANYGQLRDFVLRRFSEHVGLPIAHEGHPLCIREGGNSRPSTFQYVKCRGVWCVAPIPVYYHPADMPVKGGGKVRRVADQNCGTPALCTPPDTGCQLFPIHFFDTLSGPGFCGSVGALLSGWEPPGWRRCCDSRNR
jgi:hypothetical protein